MLACFEAMARLGSRQTAAAELNVTEGAVAKQLRGLEQWLNTPLFESGGRESAMTAAGRRLAQAVTAAMETIYPAYARIRKSLGEMTRKLSVTSSQ